MTSAIASGEGWKYFRTFSAFLCRDFAIGIGRLAPPSPRCVSPARANAATGVWLSVPTGSGQEEAAVRVCNSASDRCRSCAAKSAGS